jgi:hypothetical protein
MVALVFSGVVSVATGAAGDKLAGHSYACFAGPGVEAARVLEICADLQAVIRKIPATSDVEVQDTPLAQGPGVEIEVTQASDTRLEVVPALIDASGQRSPQPASGLVVADTTMTSARRRAFLEKLLFALPK